MWFIHGNCVVHSWHPSALNEPVAKFSNFFSYRFGWVTFAKICFLIEKTARYLKQYLFCVPTQDTRFFVSKAKLVQRRQPYPMCAGTTNVCMYICMYVCTCVYVCMYICMYVCVYVCIYVCMYVCVSNMVYCLLHYLHFNSNTTSLVHLFGIVVIFLLRLASPSV